MLTAQRLRQLLSYDQDTGNFVWLVAVGRAAAGDQAGFYGNKHGGELRIDKKLYLTSRLWMMGEWPSYEIDHINGNPHDNRWCNLRAATSAQNSWNSRKHTDNVSGLKGVTFRKDTGKWFARLMKDGKRVHLGNFDSPEAAHVAYAVAADKAFGDFARP